MIQIEKEANEIGRQTGRGNGNFIIASRNVVSALAMTDALVSWGQQGLQNGSLNTDTNNSVFAGVLGGRFKVYIDQYAQFDYFVVGYKGANEMDAGVYYSPYVPLTTLRGQNPANMQPVMAMKTRYAMSVNPFALPQEAQIIDGSPLRTIGKNPYYRRVIVKGL
ncbi:Major capsid protein Gp23 [compost metagenome]